MSKPAKSKVKGFPWFFYFFSIIITVSLIAFLADFILGAKPAFQNLIDYSKYDSVQPISYSWSSSGSAAAGTTKWGIKESNGDDGLYPTASTAKIITALVILNKEGLDVEKETLKITKEDVELYNLELSRGGSNLPVRAGTVFTLKDALTGMLLVSANNIANSLAIHIFGSLENYRTAALDFLKKHDCEKTKIGSDASGLDKETVSTASEMVKIGIMAVENDVLKNIVSLHSAEVPDNGTIYNTNELLGKEGFIGIKTGTTPAAGSCLVSAFEKKIGNESVVIVVAILGDTSDKRFEDAEKISHILSDAIVQDKIIEKGEIIGRFDYSSGKKEWMTADGDIFRVHFSDEPIKITFQRTSSHTGEIVDIENGEQIGTASFPDHIENVEFCKLPKNNLERFKNALWTPQCN